MVKIKLIVNKITFFLIAMLWSSVAFGQRHELGVRGGLTSMVGDVGRTSYFQKPMLNNLAEVGAPLYMGVLYRMNFNPYQTLRFNVGYTQIPFNDSYAKEQYRRSRGKYGSNSGLDADVLFEYNFFPVNNEQKGMLSPYIFGGLGASLYSVRSITFQDNAQDTDPLPILYEDQGNTRTYFAKEGFGDQLAFAIPFGVGLKYKFNYNWAISAEAMFRPMFSDGIDYSVVDEKDVKVTYNKNNEVYKNSTTRKAYVEEAKRQVNEYLEHRNFGNRNSNDWVNTLTLSLTYSFGRPPCYCDQ